MTHKKIIAALVCMMLAHTSLYAIDAISFFNAAAGKKSKQGAKYWSAGDDGILFSNLMGSPFSTNFRFSMFINTGFHYNYNISKNVAVLTGFDIKNLGFARRYTLTDTAGKKYNFVYRNRNYYAGIPVGLRIGNLKRHNEFLIGGGVDFAIHHKEKIWTEGSKRSTKTKKSAWFDNNNSNIVNPYIYAGFKVRGAGLKFQYYLNEYAPMYNSNLYFISILLPSGPSGLGDAVKVTKAGLE